MYFAINNIHPHQRARNYGAHQCRELPDRKPPRQRYSTATRHLDTPTALTPERHIINQGQNSATPTH